MLGYAAVLHIMRQWKGLQMFSVMEFDGEKLVPLGTRQLDTSKIDWHDKPHSGCSMVKEGVYPEGTTREQVEAKVKGTFGGRFEQFGAGKFRYVAYTD